jgi:uncharacterized membrane protein YdbT with pleckstrin-like domain
VAFPKKLLHDREQLVLDLRPHWWFMAPSTAALVAALAFGLWVWIGGGEGTEWDALSILAAVVVLAAVAWFVSRYLSWVSTYFVVTTDRCIYRSGVLAKHGIEIPLERINTVFFHQGVFERLLGLGDLSIESGGETGKQSFSDIRRPSSVQNEIYRQMEENENRKFDRIGRETDERRTLSIPEQLEKLDELRQRGVISEQEFTTKKTDLLNRM